MRRSGWGGWGGGSGRVCPAPEAAGEGARGATRPGGVRRGRREAQHRDGGRAGRGGRKAKAFPGLPAPRSDEGLVWGLVFGVVFFPSPGAETRTMGIVTASAENLPTLSFPDRAFRVTVCLFVCLGLEAGRFIRWISGWKSPSRVAGKWPLSRTASAPCSPFALHPTGPIPSAKYCCNESLAKTTVD